MASSIGNNSSGSWNMDGRRNDSNDEQDRTTPCICNICLDTAKDAVVSLCGHLYCWPCLHKWLQTRLHQQSCPVCKSEINPDKIIPIYGPGSSKQHSKNQVMPPRPSGQRIRPPIPRIVISETNDYTGFHDERPPIEDPNIGFGMGSHTLNFLASINSSIYGQRELIDEQLRQDDEFISKLFIMTVIVFVSFLLLA